MKGQFVILRKATTETGKTFYWYEHHSFGYGTDIMRELKTLHNFYKGIGHTIEAEGLFQFKTMKEAIKFEERGDENEDNNGTGMTAFLKEIAGES